MKNKRPDATLVGYRVLFDTKGNLVTERTSTDIKKLKKFLSREDYSLLRTIIFEATSQIDQIHNQIEATLNARK
tara:strand:+ start:591 stop:812 length:222 start_codon:yes stop_codon:yes gene_type:complete